jgi:uncharacterized membrane protein YkvA (DUF1232 family)
MLSRLKQWARVLKTELLALYLAYRDPRVPWYARLLAALVVGYALSPIDLIPDPIPVLGYLDDLILVPLGIWLCLKLIPTEVMTECRSEAEAEPPRRAKNWWAAGVVLLVWLGLGVWAFRLVADLLVRR